MAEKSIDDVEQVYPKTITNIRYEGKTIRVDGEGIQGGEYFYTVNPDDSCKAFFVDPAKEKPVPRSYVAFAELTHSNGLITVKRGVYDSR